ncbi:MAG: autotransporter outer membrane beta-barrel domain-containing protein [Akkermansia sp.]|nr:autotransporter outer membrane beta-barrel domain-containing protein [Akkermansia sp.]
MFPDSSHSSHNITINMTGGEVSQIIGGNANSKEKVDTWMDENPGKDNPSVINGDIAITVSGGTVGSESTVDAIVTSDYGHAVNGDVSVTISGAETTINGNIVGGARWARGYANSSTITIEDGTINGNVYAGGNVDKAKADENDPNPEIHGDISFKMTGGTVNGDVLGAGEQVNVNKDSKVEVELSGGAVTGNVYGAGVDCTVGDVEVTIDGANVTKNVYGAGKDSTVKGNSTVKLLAGNVGGVIDADGEGSTVGGESVIEVGTDEKAFTGTVGDISGFDRMIVSKGSSIQLVNGNAFSTSEMSITLSEANMRQAAVKGAYAAVGEEGLTLHINFAGPATSGKYMVVESGKAPEGWSEETVKVDGVVGFSDLTWEGTTLYLTYRALGIDAAVLSNWGVFKSSQAFVSTLWGARDNVVSLDGPPATDEKGNVLPAPAEAKNIAWGTVYGMSGRISDAGADYSLYGMAVGAERKFGKNSSVGLALGYDWGKVSPFTTTNVDQESVHLALYGRVGEWKAGKGVVAVDWSAAVGDTTSEHRDYRGDWSQTSWQLDTRATYSRAINERTTASAFVGMQYYTHDSATADGVHVSGIENLRFQVGGGMSRKVSERTSVYGEASMYFDAMRDNPYAVEGGLRFKGTNPGRVGGKIGVGASYSINDKWSARGGYSFDVADDSTEHNVNVGATYKF